MIKWIRTSRLSIKNSLSAEEKALSTAPPRENLFFFFMTLKFRVE